MPYSKSLARQDFESEFFRIKKLAKKSSFASSPISYDHKQLIFQSCIFNLSARIEDYTKSLIEGILFNYRSRGAKLSDLHENIRIKGIIDNQTIHYRNYYNQSDEKKLIQNLSIKKGTFNLLDDDIVFVNQVKSINIISTNKYPSVKNLKKIYNRIGIEDIVAKINAESKRDLKTAFESFLNLRESIAHQSPPNITFQDVERHYDNVKQYINFIDRIVYKHICKFSTSKYW